MEVVEFLRSLSVGDVGAVGLLSLAVFLLLTGRIVPRSVVDDIRETADARVKDAREETGEWRQAHTTLTTAFSELNEQLKPAVLEYARTSDHLLRSIQERAQQ